MKEAALKSFNHLYRILKVYLTMAICGALAVVGIQLLLAKTLLAVSVLAAVILVALALFLFVFWSSGQETAERNRKLFESRKATAWRHIERGAMYQWRAAKPKEKWHKKK